MGQCERLGCQLRLARVDVVKTPVVFILDDKNKIIAKNIQGDNIAKIMELLDEGKLKF